MNGVSSADDLHHTVNYDIIYKPFYTHTPTYPIRVYKLPSILNARKWNNPLCGLFHLYLWCMLSKKKHFWCLANHHTFVTPSLVESSRNIPLPCTLNNLAPKSPQILPFMGNSWHLYISDFQSKLVLSSYWDQNSLVRECNLALWYYRGFSFNLEKSQYP